MKAIFLLAIILSCFGSVAPAAVQYKFSGVVTSVSSPIASEFQVGEIVSGHMTLTLAVAEFDRAFYDVTNFYANIGGDYPITSSGGVVKVLNDFGGTTDSVGLDVIDPSYGLSAPAVNGHSPDYFSFNLLYSGTSALTSVDLLPQFIFGAPLDRSNLRFGIAESINVQFALTDFSVDTSVPEPAAIAVWFLLSASSLVACRIKRQNASGR